MYSKSIVSVVCIPGWSGSRYAIAPGNFCSASFRATSISDGAAEVAPSGGSVNKPNRNPPRGGKYVTGAGGDPSSGKVGATSAPQRRWNSSPGSSATLRPSTSLSVATVALPSSVCPVTTRRSSFVLPGEKVAYSKAARHTRRSSPRSPAISPKPRSIFQEGPTRREHCPIVAR